MSPIDFVESLHELGIDYFAGVPDSLLKSLCACVAERVSSQRHVICANEGAAVGMAIGYHLATGRVAAVYMQNSGLGNAVNPLLSLADPEVYAVPLLMIIGWRGQPGIKDEPQHIKQGRVMHGMLDAMEIPSWTLSPDRAGQQKALNRIQRHFDERASACALIVPKDCFAPHAGDPSARESDSMMSREQAITCITEALMPEDLVVSTTGMASRELFEIRESRSQPHERDFMLVGGMGHTSAVALALAQSAPSRRVVCLDGDGSALMHLGSLAIAGQSGCGNFKHVVINNGAHDSVGGQPTVGFDVDLCQVARALGYEDVARCDDRSRLEGTLPRFLQSESVGFLEVRVRVGHRSDLGRPTTTPLDNKQAFRRFVDG